MATHSVARAKHATLVAATVDTVNLSGDTPEVEVLNRGGDYIYFTLDGSVPTSGGDDTYVVPPGSALQVPDWSGAGPSQVKLISASAVAYSVQVAG